MKKIFISVGTKGRQPKQVDDDIQRAKEKIKKIFSENVEVIDNWNCQGSENSNHLYYLGEAIKKLGECNVCYFVKGWQYHKGCKAELNICELYGIKVMFES